MLARIVPVAVLASAAVSLHGCGGGGTTTTTGPAPSPSPSPSPGPSPPGPSLINGTCNAEKFPGVEDCDRVDFGSCGNACCEITTTVPLTPEAVAKALNASLADGGPDGQYELQHLFEGVTGFANISSSIGYLGQVHHTTAGPGHYTDKVNFHIEPDGDNAKVTAFSLSLIGGALGDSGQSYKNIIMALKGANLTGWSDASVMNAGGSCPPPAGKTAALAQSAAVEVTQRRRLADDVINGTCGLTSPSTVSDCQNVDLGSCGNACCSLTVTLPVSAEQAFNILNSSFDNGGPDGQFTKQPMAEETLGFANLTGGPPPEAAAFGFGSGAIFIGQLHHMTTGGKYHFNDTVNINIVDGEGGATINAFSTSLVGGAYSDMGQNYKNLMMLLSVFGNNASVAPGKFSTSCPAPTLLV